jgi:hypothetical protein
VVTLAGMTGIQPELWVDRAAAAVAFYVAAFGAPNLDDWLARSPPVELTFDDL